MPSAPARCAVVLLTDTTASQAADQCRESINVVEIVDVLEPLDLNAELAFQRLPLGESVAVLQIDEAAARQAENALEVVQSGALALPQSVDCD